MVAQPLLEFEAAELAVRLDHGPLAVRPAGLDRVQPRALARQAAEQQAAAPPGRLAPAAGGHQPGAAPPARVTRGWGRASQARPRGLGCEAACTHTRARPGTPAAGSRSAAQARKEQV